MFETGYLRVFSWKGVPLRLHWTLPLGALVFSGGAIAPFFWLAFFVLVLLHEVGHALVVRRLGHHVTAIDITGFGGMCRWTGYASPLERSVISWGGVSAQLVLLAMTLGLVAIFPILRQGWSAQIVSVFLSTNLWIAALNLLPFPPLDGHQAWKLVPELRRSGGVREFVRVLLRRSVRVRPQVSHSRGGPSWWSTLPWPWVRKPALGDVRASNVSQKQRTQVPAEKGGMDTKELADMLRNIGDQAGKARRPDKSRWN